MPLNFTLHLATRPGTRIAEFDLRDAAGSQLGYREVDFATLPAGQVHLFVSDWQNNVQSQNLSFQF
jgi:hypothetical protein